MSKDMAFQESASGYRPGQTRRRFLGFGQHKPQQPVASPSGEQALDISATTVAPPIPREIPNPGRRKLVFAAVATLLTGGGIAAFAALNRDGSDASSGEPGEGQGGLGTEAPRATNTPDKPKPSATPSATPTEVFVPEVDVTEPIEGQLPYELALDSIFIYEGSDYTIHFGTSKKAQTQTTVSRPPFGEKPFQPVQKFFLSDREMKRVKKDITQEQMVQNLNDAILLGHLAGLKQDERYKDWTIDTLKQRIKAIRDGQNVEHPTYTVAMGNQGKDEIYNPITIDASKRHVYIHVADNPGNTPANFNESYNYRAVNQKGLAIELFSDNAFYKNDQNPNFAAIGVPNNLSNALAFLSVPTAQNGGIRQELSAETKAKTLLTIRPVNDLLVPYKENATLTFGSIMVVE